MTQATGRLVLATLLSSVMLADIAESTVKPTVKMVKLVPAADVHQDWHSGACAPHPRHVVTSPTHKYTPYFINLHRCNGSIADTPPNVKKCVAIATVPVVVMVTNLATGKNTTTELRNHTKCGSACVNTAQMCNQYQEFNVEGSCLCSCKYRRPNPSPCKAPRVWSQGRCGCKCPQKGYSCGADKWWNPENCECQCKPEVFLRCNGVGIVDKKSCLCKQIKARSQTASTSSLVSSAGVSYEVFGLTVGGILLFVILGVILFSYREKLPGWHRTKFSKNVNYKNAGGRTTDEDWDLNIKDPLNDRVDV